MKPMMKTALLLTVCCVFVNGRNLGASQSKKDLTAKALTDMQKHDIGDWFQQQEMGTWFPTTYQPGGGEFAEDSLSGKVEQIKSMLSLLIENLDAFEARNDNGVEQTLQNEIDGLNEEIQNLHEMLQTAVQSPLYKSLWEIIGKLFQLEGSDFYFYFMDNYDLNDMEEEPIMPEEYESTGNWNTNQSPAKQLAETAQKVKTLETLAKIKIELDKRAHNLSNAIVTALDRLNSDKTVNQTTSSHHTTQSSGTTANQPSTTESPSTTPEPEPTSPTENPMPQRKSFLRRRLQDLLLKKLLKESHKEA